MFSAFLFPGQVGGGDTRERVAGRGKNYTKDHGRLSQLAFLLDESISSNCSISWYLSAQGHGN